jgi:hypothetical protein
MTALLLLLPPGLPPGGNWCGLRGGCLLTPPPLPGNVVAAFAAAPSPPAAAATSPTRGFVDVVVDYPRGPHDEWRWCDTDIFSRPPLPATPRPPPSISTTTKGTSLPPPM